MTRSPSRFPLLFLLLAFSLALWAPCVAQEQAGGMRYVYNAPESAQDVRYLFHWEILRAALEKTRAGWGSYTLQPSQVMSEKRQLAEMKRASGMLTVMYLDALPEYEKYLIPIRIPVDKNLVGYRIFLIRNEDRARFNAVHSLADLRKFSYGLGLAWSDVAIMQHNGFTVVTGPSYEGLFEMLATRRFDVFPRGVGEVLDEFDQRKGKLPSLAIEDGIMLYYPLPMYFWFAKTPEGTRLAKRVEEGMRGMIADGSYDQLFDKYFREKIQRLHLHKRKLFTLNNPHLGPETPFADKKLWFDPALYREEPHGK